MKKGTKIKKKDSWSTEDDQILRDSYFSKGTAEIIPLLSRPRSHKAILQRVCRLKITNSNPWTPEEDDMLKAFYGTGEWSLGKPNRTIMAIHTRAKNLNVRMPLVVRIKVYKQSCKNNGRQSFINYGKILGCVVAHYLFGAKARKIDCALLDGSIENTQYLDSIAKDTCALSGRPITYKILCRETLATASLDRIDSSKGYIKGNVQWIHKDINRIKWDMPEEDFIQICKDVALHQTK